MSEKSDFFIKTVSEIVATESFINVVLIRL